MKNMNNFIVKPDISIGGHAGAVLKEDGTVVVWGNPPHMV